VVDRRVPPERTIEVKLSETADRLHAHIRECNRRYPDAWRWLDAFRDDREKFGGWPPWCFCPLSASYAIVSRGQDSMPIEFAVDVGRIAALGAWRVSQGIYRIDPTIREAVMETPLAGELPMDVLLTLPEWCVYVETPDYVIGNTPLHGFFAHLEHDANDGRTELRMELDLGGIIDYDLLVISDPRPFDSLVPEILHLRRGGTFDEGYRAMLAEMRKRVNERKVGFAQYAEAEAEVLRTARTRVPPLVSLLLYICSQTAEYRLGGESRPSRPSYAVPTKTKRGWRLFPPDRPKTWFVGERLGEAIRNTQHAAREHGDRSGPRPHVRRAHWHSFWTGSKTDSSQRKIVLRWLPPIPVAMAEDTPEARMKIDRLKRITNLAAELGTAAQHLENRNASPGNK
jgi:hypothetical protein